MIRFPKMTKQLWFRRFSIINRTTAIWNKTGKVESMDSSFVMKWFVWMLRKERSETEMSRIQKNRISQTVRKDRRENGL